MTGTSVVMAALLSVVMIAQVRERRYVPWLYWATVVLISIVGTLITDSLTDTFDIPLAVTAGVFSVALLATFGIWYWRKRTLSIHTIVTRTRELFYWAAILFTFALGTAAGDLVAESMNLGYGVSALLFGGMIAAVAAAHFGLKMNAVLAFWLAYILTRPFGASFGDLLSQPVADGGIGLGTVVTSGLFLAAITGLVLFLAVSRKDVIEAEVAS